MKKIFALLPLFLLSVSCASTTVIKSVPSGAKVYINGSLAGNTPYQHSDTKIVGSTTKVELKKAGCKKSSYVIQRNEQIDVGACVGGLFVLVPFLWVMGYNPERTYELECKKQSNIFDGEIGGFASFFNQQNIDKDPISLACVYPTNSTAPSLK